LAIILLAHGGISANAGELAANVPRPHPAGDALCGVERFAIGVRVRRGRMRRSDVGHDRERPGVDNLVPRLARTTPIERSLAELQSRYLLLPM